MAADADLAAVYLRRAPKTELHVHLEGAVRPARLFRILQRHGLHPEVRRPEDLEFLYRHASFDEFLEHFRFAVTSLRDVDDVHAVAGDLFAELAAQHVVYAEVIFSAAIFLALGMPLDELLAAVDEAAVAHERPGETRYNLVVDLVRNFGPEKAEHLVGELARAGHARVVGVHLGGDEVGFPARMFERAFRRAGEAGFGLAAHAGEGDGPASVREAIERLGVRRIGHGVRSVEDPLLVRDLAAGGVTLELCPTSNVRTGVVSAIARHPLPVLVRAGVRATLGADDPSFFDTDLTREMLLVHTELGLSLEEVDRLTDAGIESAFVPDSERSARLAALRQQRGALRAALGLATSST